MSIVLVRGAIAAERFELAPGSHPSREDGLCAMEAVAWLAGLPHSDKPACTSEVLGGYVRHLNDNMPDERRGRLIAFLPDLVGTADPKFDHVLNYYLAWQAIHVFAPAALRTHEHGGYDEDANLLEDQFQPWEAVEAARAIWIRRGGYGDLSPALWAVTNAEKALRLADWFYSERTKPGRGEWGDTRFDGCARASAAAAFHAYRSGYEAAWDDALLVLEEAIGFVNT